MIHEAPLNLALSLRQAQFALGAARLDQLPHDSGHEVLWAGRSNVGKSSVLNAITGQAKLARVSKTPGRTQQLNVFSLDAQRRLIDAPGYGYAKTTPAQREYWRQQLAVYLHDRAALRGVILVMDIRQPVTPLDQTFLAILAAADRPCHVLLNKADKLSKMQALKTLQQTRTLLGSVDARISVQRFSVLHHEGVEELLSVLTTWLA